MSKVTPAKLFSTALTVGDLTVKGVPFNQLIPAYSGPSTVNLANAGKPAEPWDTADNLSGAVIDIIVARTMAGASNITVQLADPDRVMLRSKLLTQGEVLTMDGMNFAFVQYQKEGDQLQLVFEAAIVYDLRHQKGAIATSSSTDLVGFAKQLLRGVSGVKFVYYDEPLTKAISLSRGGTSYPDEDSWTCLNRLATTGGWRCFESEGTIYLGPDSWLLGEAIPLPAGSPGLLQEFTTDVQDMDVDFDYGKPYGQLVATVMMDLWPYQPGNRLKVQGMGPCDDVKWLVYSMQRDFFNKQCSVVLQAPTPAAIVAAGTPSLSNI